MSSNQISINTGSESQVKWYARTEVQLVVMAGVVTICAFVSAILISKGFQQFEFKHMDLRVLSPFSKWGVYKHYQNCMILSPLNLQKTVALLVGGGAAAGCAVFGSKLFLKKAEKALAKKESEGALRLKKAIHIMDSGFSLACLVAGAVLLSIAIYYLYHQVPALNIELVKGTIVNANVGYFACQPAVMRAAICAAAGGALATMGLLGSVHRIGDGIHQLKKRTQEIKLAKEFKTIF